MVDCDGRRAPDRRDIEPWRMASGKYKAPSEYLGSPSVHLPAARTMLRRGSRNCFGMLAFGGLRGLPAPLRRRQNNPIAASAPRSAGQIAHQVK